MSRKLNGEIWKNGRKFIPLNIASASSGYHREYLRQLIKNGKLAGERIKSSWFIEEDVFSSFIKNNPTNISYNPNQNDSKIESKLAALEEKLEKIAINLNYIKQSVVKTLAVLLIVSAAGFFILKNPESIYANFRDFRNFSNQVSVQASGLKNSLQTSAVLAAVSFQKAAVSTAASLQQTALDFPNQALNLAKQTLNQARSLSLSLSLSRQTS